MNSRRLVPIAAVIVVIAIIAIAASRKSTTTGTVTATSTLAAATTTQTIAANSPHEPIPLPEAGPVNSQWTQFSNAAKGYSIRYPADLVRAAETNGAISLTFPKNVYFHWPLLDDARITVSAGPTCSAITAAGLTGDTKPVTFELGGHTWKRTVGFDTAAGNRYEEIAYDLVENSICYHIGLLNHGSNGSGLYVDDASLIKKYDAAHDADLARVISVLNGIVASFGVSGLKG